MDVLPTTIHEAGTWLREGRLTSLELTDALLNRATAAQMQAIGVKLQGARRGDKELTDIEVPANLPPTLHRLIRDELAPAAQRQSAHEVLTSRSIAGESNQVSFVRPFLVMLAKLYRRFLI